MVSATTPSLTRQNILIMLIAKTIDAKGRAQFSEVLRVGTVQFDRRDGWVLLSAPIDVRQRKRELRWMHPEDDYFEWVREFRFASPMAS